MHHSNSKLFHPFTSQLVIILSRFILSFQPVNNAQRNLSSLSQTVWWISRTH